MIARLTRGNKIDRQPKNHLQHFKLTEPELIETTALANVYRARQPEGNWVALKCWHNPNSEKNAITYLQALDGQGAVSVLGHREGAVILEHLDGPHLGDLSRSGRDKEASEILVQVAYRLHQSSEMDLSKLPSVERWFRALFQTDFASDCSAQLRADIEASRLLARNLLDTSTAAVALHGDLHHDNVLAHKGEWIAIDPKGLWGDPAFEMANAMRNPNGAEQLMRAPEIIQQRAAIYADAFGISPKRMLQWAAAKTALSISWRGNGSIKEDEDSDLLHRFLEMST